MSKQAEQLPEVESEQRAQSEAQAKQEDELEKKPRPQVLDTKMSEQIILDVDLVRDSEPRGRE